MSGSRNLAMCFPKSTELLVFFLLNRFSSWDAWAQSELFDLNKCPYATFNHVYFFEKLLVIYELSTSLFMPVGLTWFK
jgi:hypothetical protein